MGNDLGVFLARLIADTWGPDKNSHCGMVTNPALVFQARVDAPLRRAWHDLLMAKLPLNYHLSGLVTGY